MQTSVLYATTLAAAIAATGIAAAAPLQSEASVVYIDAAGAVPTLHCRTPNRQTLGNCAIFLPPGEKLRSSAFITDMKRWALDNTSYGPDPGATAAAAPNTPDNAVVLIKERTDVAGITTIVYIPTTGRDGMYRAIVVSDPNAPMVSELHFMHVVKIQKPRVVVLPKAKAARASAYVATFSAARAAAANARAVAAAEEKRRAVSMRKAQLRAMVTEIENSPCQRRLDAEYSSPVGQAAFRPVDVYNDGEHTCIVLPTSYDGFAIPYAGDEMVHFHWREAQRMLVIDSLPSTIVLRDGGQSVTISHK